MDRLRQIAVSAMLQSQKSWLPQLSDPTPLSDLIRSGAGHTRYIAHCLESPHPTESLAVLARHSAPSSIAPQATKDYSSMILIGPEGDFSPNEVEMALAQGFLPVTLGPHRLRTETAGVVAATLLCIA